MPKARCGFKRCCHIATHDAEQPKIQAECIIVAGRWPMLLAARNNLSGPEFQQPKAHDSTARVAAGGLHVLYAIGGYQ